MPGLKPLSVKLAEEDVPTCEEPRKIWYPVTATLSVEAVQLSEAELEVVEETVRLPGGLGG